MDPGALKVRYLQVRLARHLLDLHPEGAPGRLWPMRSNRKPRPSRSSTDLRDLGGTIGMAAVPGVPPTVLTGG